MADQKLLNLSKRIQQQKQSIKLMSSKQTNKRTNKQTNKQTNYLQSTLRCGIPHTGYNTQYDSVPVDGQPRHYRGYIAENATQLLLIWLVSM